MKVDCDWAVSLTNEINWVSRKGSWWGCQGELSGTQEQKVGFGEWVRAGFESRVTQETRVHSISLSLFRQILCVHFTKCPWTNLFFAPLANIGDLFLNPTTCYLCLKPNRGNVDPVRNDRMSWDCIGLVGLVTELCSLKPRFESKMLNLLHFVKYKN